MGAGWWVKLESDKIISGKQICCLPGGEGGEKAGPVKLISGRWVWKIDCVLYKAESPQIWHVTVLNVTMISSRRLVANVVVNIFEMSPLCRASCVSQMHLFFSDVRLRAAAWVLSTVVLLWPHYQLYNCRKSDKIITSHSLLCWKSEGTLDVSRYNNRSLFYKSQC